MQIFEISGQPLHWFVLVLRVSLYFAPDTIYESPEVFKAFLEEIFELQPGHCYRFIVMLFALEQLLSDQSMQKRVCK